VGRGSVGGKRRRPVWGKHRRIGGVRGRVGGGVSTGFWMPSSNIRNTEKSFHYDLAIWVMKSYGQ
jgi:hypothetical protein